MRYRLLGGIAAMVIALGALAFPSAGPARAGSTCTGWKSYLTPPTSIRVYRTATKRTVTVPFRTYVEKVMAAEWGPANPRAALEVGAVAVKQFAWYYAMHWRGGKDAAGRCYDVRDSSVDQVYDPSRTVHSRHKAAVAATWRVSLRKGDRFFLTGYRPGTGSCTAHIDGWKLYQRDATDCVRRYSDTAERLARRFFSSVSWITPGVGDYSGDGRGDMAAVSTSPDTGEATAHVFTTDQAYRSAVTAGSLDGEALWTTPPEQVLGRAAGDLDADGRRDLVQLVRSGDGLAVEVSEGTSKGLRSASAWWKDDLTPAAAGDAAFRLVVSDFTGDGRADAGIVRIIAGDTPTTTLFVAVSSGSGISSLTKTWSTAADLSTSEFLAGDMNGDGLGDLVVVSPIEAGGTALRVARSTSSRMLGTLATWGTESLGPTSLRTLVGDVNRDGRDDVIVVRRTSGGGSRVVAQRSPRSGTSFSRIGLTDTLALPFASTRFSVSDTNADGRADLWALVDRGVDVDGNALGTAMWRLLSNGASTLDVRSWGNAPTLDWATTLPY